VSPSLFDAHCVIRESLPDARGVRFTVDDGGASALGAAEVLERSDSRHFRDQNFIGTRIPRPRVLARCGGRHAVAAIRARISPHGSHVCGAHANSVDQSRAALIASSARTFGPPRSRR